MENFENLYPPKPELIRKKRNGHIAITFFSIVLFVLTFSLIIDDYLLIGILLLVLLLHEGGHFLMMKIFKYEELNMLFIPFLGAMVSGKKEKYSQIESSLMVLAGPLPGIILGAFLLLFMNDSPNMLILQIGVILILLNVINLIPIAPLDGGQLIRILFFNNYELSQLIFTVLSSLSIMIVGIILNSWLIIIFGFLLGIRIRSKYRFYLIRRNMRNEEIEYESNYEDISNKTFAKIKDIVTMHTPALEELKDYDSEDSFNQILAQQVNNVLFPPTKRDASLFYKLFILFLWIGSIMLSIYALKSIDLNLLQYAFQNR